MKIKLNFLEVMLPSVPAEQLALLQHMHVSGKCDDLITYAKNLTSQVTDVQIQRTLFERIYEMAFEYAISCGAHAFIDDMLLHGEEICRYLNHSLLYEYAATRDAAFQSTAFLTTINFPSTSISMPAFFANSAAILFSRDDDEHMQLIDKVLSNPQVKPEVKSQYLYDWVNAYCNALSMNPSDSERINDVFHRHLPKDQESLTSVLFIFADHVQDLANEQIEIFLNKYPFTSEQIVSVLGRNFISGHRLSQVLSRLKSLINRIDQNHPNYADYQLFYQILAADPANRPTMMLANQRIAFTDAIPEQFRTYLIRSLTRPEMDYFINWYTEHPDFQYESVFSWDLYHLSKQVVKKFFSTPHVKIPNFCLSNLICRKDRFTDTAAIVGLIAARPDVSFKNDNLFLALFTLFVRGDKESIEILLNHPEVYSLLKNYYLLRGDDQLPRYDRGRLMPWVIAWYISASEKHPGKAKELFMSFSEPFQQELLKGFVLSMNDPTQPTLRVFIIRSGNAEMIEAIGGVNPRLVKVSAGQPTIFFVPNRFRKPKVMATLHRVQQRIACRYAHKNSEAFHHLDSTDTIQQLSEQAARHIRNKELRWQHETTRANAVKIVSDNRFKSRQHIEGSELFGQASDGLDFTMPLNSKSPFVYFSRVTVTAINHGKTSHFVDLLPTKQALFVINAPRLLADNPHIKFIIIGPYPFFEKKSLVLPGGHVLVSDPQDFYESMEVHKVEIDASQDTLLSITQKMFRYVFKKLINNLHEPLKSEMIEKLTDPKSEEDRKLAIDLLDLLHLEWLVPGDVELRFSYIDEIQLGDQTYNFSELRETVTNAQQTEVIKAIDAHADMIKNFPFVLNGIMHIAYQRKHNDVIMRLMRFGTTPRAKSAVHYYPDEVYQIEALAQLLLEDIDNGNDDRVYVHCSEDKLTIHATLQTNSNHGGAHSAQMAKLHCALGAENLHGQDALTLQLPDSLTVSFGAHETFKSLSAIRDALLTYELSTLLTSKNNEKYYLENGDHHPITGRGATNGKVSLLKNRLYFGEMSYQLTAVYDEKAKRLCLQSDKSEPVAHLAATLSETLNISSDHITIDTHKNQVIIEITPSDLIAKLRKKAICYEGINVMTDDGRLLLAERIGKGLASAGGHHDKYSDKNIAHGLRSEFGLEFIRIKTLADLEQQVTLLSQVKTSGKTGIYVVSTNDLIATNDPVGFRPDPEEFVQGSGVALTLVEMRGKKFYHVMPIAELCDYQLAVVKKCLEEDFPEAYSNMALTIDNHVDMVSASEGIHKIPGATFGRVKVTITGELPKQFERIFEEKGRLTNDSTTSKRIYEFEETPFAILQAIKTAQCAPSRAP